MTSIIKRWVLLMEIPFYIRDLRGRGYNKFSLTAGEDPKRVEMRAWTYVTKTVSRQVHEPQGSKVSHKWRPKK